MGRFVASRLGYHDTQKGEGIATRPQATVESADGIRGRTAGERAVVRYQLECILASPPFRNSKRCTSLLRFVVERRLEGDTEGLKERLLGIEVFGRDPDYNTTQDPVVRTSAVEVRKRLAEYYQQPGHEQELRIELPAGCYVPEFHPVAEVAEVRGSEPVPQKTGVLSRRHVFVVTAAVAVACAVAATGWKAAHPPAIESFWAPMTGAQTAVLFSVMGTPPAETSPGDPATLSGIFRNGQNSVPLPDVTALVRVAGFLGRSGKPQRIELSRNIQFQDLKAGPAVIIGPVAPRWKDLLTSDWRFSVERDSNVTLTWIQDRQKPDARPWSVEVNAPADSSAEAYALVSRVWNDTLGQTIVSIAGLSPYGTTAAGEFLADPAALEAFAAGAPRGWDKRNIQLVVGARRIGTTSGRPRVVMAHFW